MPHDSCTGKQARSNLDRLGVATIHQDIWLKELCQEGWVAHGRAGICILNGARRNALQANASDSQGTQAKSLGRWSKAVALLIDEVGKRLDVGCWALAPKNEQLDVE